MIVTNIIEIIIMIKMISAKFDSSHQTNTLAALPVSSFCALVPIASATCFCAATPARRAEQVQ